MSELEELPSWAGRNSDDKTALGAAAEETTTLATSAELPREPGKPSWRIPLLALLGVLALVGVGALGYILADSGSSGTETAAEDAEDETTDSTIEDTTADETEAEETDAAMTDAEGENGAADEEPAEQPSSTVAEDGETVTVDVGGEDEASEGEEDADTATSDPNASGRQAVFRGGKVYLSGPVPSEEVGKLIEGKAAAVVGPDNVVNEYTIDPTSTVEPGGSAPLYVEDVVLFEFNSISIAAPFLPILDLGTLLLSQNPQASVTVVTRTDAVGSEAVNLDVATKRAQAVINYWLGKGVNPDQIKADPRGEEGASEDDDEETAALNRRAEFIITGLLD